MPKSSSHLAKYPKYFSNFSSTPTDAVWIALLIHGGMIEVRVGIGLRRSDRIRDRRRCVGVATLLCAGRIDELSAAETCFLEIGLFGDLVEHLTGGMVAIVVDGGASFGEICQRVLRRKSLGSKRTTCWIPSGWSGSQEATASARLHGLHGRTLWKTQVVPAVSRLLLWLP